MMRRITLWTLCVSMLPAFQPALSQTRIPIGATISAAERLERLGIDTTNLTLIRQVAANAEHAYTAEACLFLAQRGASDVVSTLRSRFHNILTHAGGYPIDYLAGLYVLRDPETHSLATELIDKMVTQENSGLYRYSGTQWVGAFEFLLAYRDYSRYDLFASLFARGDDDLDGVWIQDFSEFAKDQDLRPRVYEKLKQLLSSPLESYRRYAMLVLVGFKDFADLQETFRSKALNDPSDKLKVEAASILMHEYSDPFVLTALETIAMTTTDTASFVEAVHMIETTNDPGALAALTRIARGRQDGHFREEMSLVVRTYWPPQPAESLAPATMLQSLVVHLQSAMSLGWLADANFVKELDNGLENAKKHIAKGDSVNCYKEIQKFQDKVNQEYEKTIDNEKKGKPRDKRFVTVEGWKFLYYNAQYIMDRLPGAKR